MGHTHTGVRQAHIYTIQRPDPVYFGCFSWDDGEDIQTRWDEWAKELWAFGVQPHEDEPVFSVTEGDTHYDHYLLVSIYDEGTE